MANPCFHCGLPCNVELVFNVDGVSRAFCCVGCQAVTQAIVSGGLGDFYRHRTEVAGQKAADNVTDLSAYDLPEVQKEFVDVLADGLGRAHFYVGGITCAACVWLIERHFAHIPGVTLVRVNAASHQATITFKFGLIKVSEILSALAKIGYPSQPLIGHELEQKWLQQQREQLLRLGVAGFGMMQAGMVAIALYAGGLQGMEPHWVQLLRWVNLLFTLPIMLYSAQPFFRAAWRSLRMAHLVMDVPVSLALILAFGASLYGTIFNSGDVYFDSVSMFTFFLLLGRYLESRARWQNSKANRQLHRLLPLTAVLCHGDQRSAVPLKQVREGDEIWIAPGTVFPCDGTVRDGASEADEALLTGEPLPQPKSAGSAVYAGTHNGSAALVVRVDGVAGQTKLAAIEALLADAEHQRPRQVELADRIASKFVAAVLLLTVGVTVFWLWRDPDRAFWIAISVLVVTCPCALSLATPSVLVAAMNHLRRRGMLITAAHTLDVMNSVDTVVFDKTGTLTSGAVTIKEVIPLAGWNEERILQMAAALEGASSHPIAHAFCRISHDLQIGHRKTFVGLGVSGVVAGEEYRLGVPKFAFPTNPLAYPSLGLWLLLADSTRPIAWISLQDELRPSAQGAVADLINNGMRCVLLSGDRKDNVQPIAEQLGISEWQGGLLPADKLAHVKQLQAAGSRVLMLGDGMNDLPVLAGADVSCAMGTSTDLAKTKAGCVLLKDDLLQISQTIRTAKRVKRIIAQNLGWALLYNLVALPLALSGLIPPWLAAIGMSTSSLVVVFNAFRVSRE